MNGAGQSYRQDEGHHGYRSCSEASGYNPVYQLDISHPQHSKTMHFDNHSVDSYQYITHGDQYNRSNEGSSVYNRIEEGPTHSGQYNRTIELPSTYDRIEENPMRGDQYNNRSNERPSIHNRIEEDPMHGDQYNRGNERPSIYNRIEEDPRHLFKITYREPLELPVPQFAIDENYVGEPVWTTSSEVPKVENSSELDLDTRIDFLIKSKALAGMHPIFSQLESEESSNDSDYDQFNYNFKSKKKKLILSPPPVDRIERFDDPEVPLSRPPSPFLNRATYLFWFNQAIELKKQAKAQEQALLEKAAKKLLHENSVSKADQEVLTGNSEAPLPQHVLDEVCSELKEIVKKDFIREFYEDAVFNTLEQWWESNYQQESIKTLPKSPVAKSENVCLTVIVKDVPRVPMAALTNGVEETNEKSTFPIKTHERIQDPEPIVEVTENISKHEKSSNVEEQHCSSALNTMDITDNIIPHEEANKHDIIQVLVGENGYSSNLNVIPRINQPILDESSLFLPFPESSEVAMVPHKRFEQDDEKNEIAMYILNKILENVPRVIEAE